MTNIDVNEQARRRQLVTEHRRAAELEMSLDEYRKAHDAKVANLIAVIRAEMERCGVDDPVEVIPEILISLEESAIAKARTAAKDAARAEVKAILRKAITHG
jgi:hypothetical protein